MSKGVAQRARLIGLTSAVVATVAIGVLLLSLFEFGQSFTRLQRLSLLLAAAVLWAVHMPLDFGGRYWSRRRSRRAKDSGLSRAENCEVL